MGYELTKKEAAEMFQRWVLEYHVFAPKQMVGEGCFSDTDVIRYEKVTSLDEIEWDTKSDYSFKEVLLAISETLFYFTEDKTQIPKAPDKDVLIFLRSCDLHALKCLDSMYLEKPYGDFYYDRIRKGAKFILMGCEETCDTGYCVSMGTNKNDAYDGYLKPAGDFVYADFKCTALEAALGDGRTANVIPDYVTENKEQVTILEHMSKKCYDSPLWKEYGDRCIGCGRCNFVCPTCTCFTMQDIFYKDNKRAGERRRVWASCQVDGYSTMAGGHEFRKSQGDRMRFKVMHKIYDFKERFGYSMCVGCGRCDDVCPEYISHSNCINRLAKEENNHE